MRYDLIISGGTVVDGTGAPRRATDVGIVDGCIVAFGELGDAETAERIDATGLIVAPGFIDSHTHLESQLFWDPAALPASQHGATTVIMGNCGLSFAPIAESDPGFGAALMSAVEQIPRSVIDSEVPFDWTTFGGFVSSLERQGTGVNTASFVGYSLVRHAAMGDRAFDGVATDDDIAAMRELVREACRSGALGLSFNRATYDHDHEGRPMIGRDADWSEVRQVVEVLTEFPGRMLQVIPSWADMSAGWADHFERELTAWTAMLKDFDLSMVWSAVSEADHEAQMDATRRARAAGADMIAGIHSIPIYTFASFEAPGLFAATAGIDFLFELSPAERLAALRDEERRAEIRARVGEEVFEAFPLRYVTDDGKEVLGNPRRFRWDQIYRAGAAPDRFELGDSIALVAAAQGVHPIDVVLDAALASDLRDVFVVFVHGNLREVTEELLHDPDTVISSNDTGAHLMLMAQTQTAHLLDYWTRQAGTLTLEQSVHLLTGRQAEAFGILDRGVLEVGKAADLVVFDESTVGPQAPELRDDLPGGGTRYVAEGIGFRRVIVNGETVLIDGEFTGNRAGRFLDPGDWDQSRSVHATA